MGKKSVLILALNEPRVVAALACSNAYYAKFIK